jgi:hypothetical protein
MMPHPQSVTGGRCVIGVWGGDWVKKSASLKKLFAICKPLKAEERVQDRKRKQFKAMPHQKQIRRFVRLQYQI